MGQGQVELTENNGMIFRHQTQMKQSQSIPNRKMHDFSSSSFSFFFPLSVQLFISDLAYINGYPPCSSVDVSCSPTLSSCSFLFLPSPSLSLDKPHQLKSSPLLSALSHRSAHPLCFPPSLPWFSCFSRLHPLSQNSSLSLFFPFDRSPPGKVLSAKNNLQPTCYMSPLHRISLLLPKNHHYSHTLS